MGLLGRESELAACQATLWSSRMPAGVVISGVPGIGKTTVFRAVVELSVASGWRMLTTTGLRGEIGVPLANLADLLDPAAREVLGQLPEVQANVLRIALGLSATAAGVDDPLMARATVNALRALAGGSRLLVAVDDEQWLDPDTRRLLATAAAWLSDAPVGWLVSVRAEHADAGLGRVLAHEFAARLVRLDLGVLGDDAVARLILNRFPGRWSPRLLRHVVQLADGNPYAALELARETVASAGRDAPAARVPATLAESLDARLCRLVPTARGVVEAAAATPRPTRRLLRAVIGDQADPAIDHALEADVLEAAPPDPVLRFTHPLLREVVLRSLTGPQLRRLHRSLAAAVDDPGEAAGHLAAGAEEPDENVAAAVEQAARQAWLRGAVAHGAALAESSVALTPDPDGLSAWRRRIVQLGCLEMAGERERGRALATKWATESVPEQFRGELVFLQGVLEDDLETGARLLAQAVDQLDQIPVLAAQAGALLANVVGVLLGRVPEGRAHADRAVWMTRRVQGDPEVVRFAFAVQADLAARAGDPEAEALLRAAVAMPGGQYTRVSFNSPETRLAWWHLRRGELDAARRLLHTALTTSEHGSSEWSTAVTHLFLTGVEWAAGHWDKAELHAAAVDRYVRESDHDITGASTWAVHLVGGSRGRVDEARAALDAAIQAAEREPDPIGAAVCRSVLGQLELSVDDPAAAVAWLEPIAGLLREHAFSEPSLITAPPDLIEAYARVGRIDDAAQYLQWLQDIAAHLDNGWARLTSSRAEAVLYLARGDPAAAVEAVSPAVAWAHELGLPLELGRCLLVLGTAQRRVRSRRAATAALDQSIGVFDKLGAQCWAAMARTQRAHLAHAAADVLTPAEQRIVELVRLGHTNAEIAATLLISVKTVEGTLTRIYRKLGVRSRIDLARRAAT
ncbi:LuxR C-terminal-related transcriptional regulator [Micromonospora sp. CPCC 205371]|nr:LuxR C-terminal-related transcriptional regulator [Micromonospora sp. CPCC 205371]